MNDQPAEVKKEVAAQSFVSVLKKKGREIPKVIKDESEIVMVRQFVTEPAMIRRGYALTINMGNFESAKIDVSISIPAYIEEMHDVDAYARDWCEQRIVQEKNEVMGVVEEKKGKDPKSEDPGY